MYKTINGWTKESMIEHIKKEFKGKSVDYSGHVEACLYRGPNGTKCAVGMFIPDEHYDSILEGYPYDNIKSRIIQWMPIRDMDALQLEHDDSHPDITLTKILEWVEKNVE